MSKTQKIETNLESGEHSPEGWVRLVYTLQARGFSGTLSLKSSSKGRYFLFLKGQPVDFWSDFKEETLARTLANAKLVTGNVLTDLGDSEAEITVVSEGLVDAKDLEKHQALRLERGLQAALGQRAGTWSLNPDKSLDSVDVSPALLPTVDLWDVLWKGTLESQDSGELLAWCGIDGRSFRRSAKVQLPFVEAANLEFLTGLEEEANLGQLIGQGLIRPDHLPALLWILTAAGILEIQEKSESSGEELAPKQAAPETSPSHSPDPTLAPISTPDDVDGSPSSQSSIGKGAGPTMSRTPLPTQHRTTGNRIEDLRLEHERRMNKDYYAFLGLNPDAGSNELREVARSLAQRMNALSRSRDLPDATRQQVRDMLAGVQRVYGTFTDQKRKEDYDARLRAGEAPLIRVRTRPGSVPNAASSSRNFQLDPEAESGGGWGLFRKGGKP